MNLPHYKREMLREIIHAYHDRIALETYKRDERTNWIADETIDQIWDILKDEMVHTETVVMLHPEIAPYLKGG